jgi:hypothetical protein
MDEKPLISNYRELSKLIDNNKDNLKVILDFIYKKNDVKYKNDNTILHILIIKYPELASKLITGKNNKITIKTNNLKSYRDIKNNHGMTLLHLAVIKNKYDIVDKLVKLGFNINDDDNEMKPPIIHNIDRYNFSTHKVRNKIFKSLLSNTDININTNNDIQSIPIYLLSKPTEYFAKLKVPILESILYLIEILFNYKDLRIKPNKYKVKNYKYKKNIKIEDIFEELYHPLFGLEEILKRIIFYSNDIDANKYTESLINIINKILLNQPDFWTYYISQNNIINKVHFYYDQKKYVKDTLTQKFNSSLKYFSDNLPFNYDLITNVKEQLENGYDIKLNNIGVTLDEELEELAKFEGATKWSRYEKKVDNDINNVIEIIKRKNLTYNSQTPMQISEDTVWLSRSTIIPDFIISYKNKPIIIIDSKYYKGNLNVKEVVKLIEDVIYTKSRYGILIINKTTKLSKYVINIINLNKNISFIRSSDDNYMNIFKDLIVEILDNKGIAKNFAIPEKYSGKISKETDSNSNILALRENIMNLKNEILESYGVNIEYIGKGNRNENIRSDLCHVCNNKNYTYDFTDKNENKIKVCSQNCVDTINLIE